MQKLTIKVDDNSAVELSGDSVKDIIEQASFWSSLPRVCPICKSQLQFSYRQTKDGDSYWGQVCQGQPKHEANFGVYKNSERGLYYKGEWKVAFQSNSQTSDPSFTNNPPNHVGQGGEGVGELITEKQRKMIYAITTSLRINQEDECQRMFNCLVGDLSKKSASDFITYLKQLEEDPSRANNPVRPEASVQQQTIQPINHQPSNLQKHGAGCTCEQCVIPF